MVVVCLPTSSFPWKKLIYFSLWKQVDLFCRRSSVGVEHCSNATIRLQLLRDGCACRLPADSCGRMVSYPVDVASTSDTIAYLSAVRLLYTRRRRRCPTVERDCSALVSNLAWMEHLLDVGLSSTNEYVRHAGACAVSEVALCCADAGESHVHWLVDKLVASICAGHRGTVTAINALARALNIANDDDEEAAAATRPSCTGGGGETTGPRRATTINRGIKTLLLERMHDRWTDVVCAASAGNGRPVVLSELVRLWRSIVIASSAGSHYYERYYSDLSSLHYLLYQIDTDPHVWLNTVRLFGDSLKSCSANERLTGGGGGGCSYETAATMAETILTGVTSRRLLFFMDKTIVRLGRDNGGTRAVQETALLAMKSLRIVAAVVHRRGAADRESSSVVDATRLVVDCLDSYAKSSALVAADARFCRWLVRLLDDRDDAIIECLSCVLDIAVAVPAVRLILDPFESFAEFLSCVSFEPDVLLDYLISDENDFLPYALKFLKAASRDYEHFSRGCGDKLENTMDLLIRLRLKILRLHENNVFPYNIIPIARLIQRCDELYSEIQ